MNIHLLPRALLCVALGLGVAACDRNNTRDDDEARSPAAGAASTANTPAMNDRAGTTGGAWQDPSARAGVGDRQGMAMGEAGRAGAVDREGMAVERVEVMLHPAITSACQMNATAAFFEFDSAKLSWSDERAVGDLARCLQSGALAGQKIKLVGRADPQGPSSYNQKLGRSRAQAVADALAREGIGRDRVTVVSRGEQGAQRAQMPYALQRRVDVQLAERRPGQYSMSSWDRDGDRRMSRDEFGTYMSGMSDFDTWDRDRSGWLDEQETTAGIYGTWDADRNGSLDEQEFTRGQGTWYRDDDRFGAFDAWDRNRDGRLDDTEWNAGYADNDIYDGWDADGDDRLYEDELAGGFHGYWDANRDGYLGDDELGEAGDLYWGRR